MNNQSPSVTELGRQPNPTPPSHITAPPPSLGIYFVLIVLAIALLALAFWIEKGNWAGFLLNLSTEIVGAIVILIIVDRRIRPSEIRKIRRMPEDATNLFLGIFVPELRVMKGFTESFLTQLGSVSLGHYISRPRLETELLAKAPNGVLVIAGSGMGKTTILQWLAKTQSELMLRRSKAYRIPVLVSIRQWATEETNSFLFWRMNDYYPISKRIFNRLLRKGRLMCIFDGLDEAVDPISIARRITGFREEYPGISVVVSCRSHYVDAYSILNLPKVVIPPFSPDEIERVYKLRFQADWDRE